jgi:hypothetical protein
VRGARKYEVRGERWEVRSARCEVREVRAEAEHVLALPVGYEGNGHAVAEKGQQDERHVDKCHAGRHQL